MRRRALLQIAAIGAVLPLVAAMPPEAPILRRASFSEIGESVVMEIDVREILRASDDEAMASLESGFATRIAFEVGLFKMGGRRPLAIVRRELELHYDPWNERWLMTTRDEGARPATREFRLRRDLIAAATRLRIRVGDTRSMQRGASNPYFVRVSALRNPIVVDDDPALAETRGQRSDLSVFSRWVGIFAASRPRAELVVELRTLAFYLVAR